MIWGRPAFSNVRSFSNAALGVPVEHPTVPWWEQPAAVGALVATLQLVLFEAGYTGKITSLDGD